MSAGDLILTIDIGTSACKSVLFREDGSMVDLATSSYQSQYPRPGWVEQRPDDWWNAVVSSVRQILSRAETRDGQVAAICVTGQMHGVVAVTADDTGGESCLTLHDQRAVSEAGQIVDRLGLAHVYELTGARLTPSSPLAKICWLSKYRSELHKKTRLYLPCKDYIKYWLTGEISTDPIDAAGTLLYDIHAAQWSPVLLAVCDLTQDRLPPVLPPWQVSGSLRSGPAQQLGLPEGVPVMVGAGDDVEFLGMGLVETGVALEHFGTTGSIMTCVDRSDGDPSQAVELYPHLDPSLWLLGGSVNNAGGALAWANRTLYGEQEMRISDLLNQRGCQADIEKPLLFLPHLSGERCPIWKPHAKAGWLGLTVEHGRDDMYRAVAEGVTFSLRHILERIEELAVPVTSIAIGKSAANSEPWLRLRASIYNRPLTVIGSTEPTSLGAMIVAGVGIGLFDDVKVGAAKTVCRQQEIVPDGNLTGVFSRLYELYKQAIERNTPFFDHMVGWSDRTDG